MNDFKFEAMGSRPGKIVVCGSTSKYPNDLVGFCSLCGGLIYVRPYAQFIAERWCGACFKVQAALNPPSFLGLLQETIEELRKELKK